MPLRIDSRKLTRNEGRDATYVFLMTTLSSQMLSQSAKSTAVIFGWSGLRCQTFVRKLSVLECYNLAFVTSAVVCLLLAGGDLLGGNWARET